MFEVQNTVYYIIAVTAVICIFLMVLYSKLKKFDPMDEPKGLVLLAIMGVQFIENMLKNDTTKEVTEKLGPYLATLFIYIFLSNISGLFGITPPTANYSVTLPLAAITCVLIEYYSIKYNGIKNYIKALFEPLRPFVIINLISKVGTLLSLSLRLFGNVMSGTVLMGLIYDLLSPFTVAYPAVLHAYFDLFSGCIQAYVFCMLTMVYVNDKIAD